MTNDEINTRCAVLAGVDDGQAFDAIGNDDDLARVIVAHPDLVDLSALSEEAEKRAAGGDFKAAFRRSAALAYAAHG